MRIQETDRVLKESRYARRGQEEPQRKGIARVWQKIVGMFRKH